MIAQLEKQILAQEAAAAEAQQRENQLRMHLAVFKDAVQIKYNTVESTAATASPSAASASAAIPSNETSF